MAKDIMEEIMAAIGQTPEGKAKLEELKSNPQAFLPEQPKQPSRPMSFPIERTSMDPVIPPHLRQYLGNKTEIEDSACGEPVAWGYPITTKMGDQLWTEIQQFGKTVFDHGQWYLVTKFLTREEAVAKYGPVVHEEFGPRGGWKTVQFGQTLFKNKIMAPAKKG